MPVFIMSLYRVLPLVVVLLAVAIAVFVVVFTTKGAQRAKEVILKLFWWVCLVGTVGFGIFALYAWGDGSIHIAWFFASCVATMLVFWLVDVIGIVMFKRKHQREYFIMKARKKKNHRA